MKLKIVQIGDPLLRQPARKLSKDEILSPRIQQLIQLMKETKDDAPGVGLAAPQIGEPLQLIIIEDKKEFTTGFTEEQIKRRERSPVPFHVIINPTLTIDDSETVEFYEGCLSMAGFVGLVPRARKVTVECLNELAVPFTIHASGWYARILQHEIDHLQGVICIDRMKTQSLTTFDNYQRYWKSSS